MASLPGVALVLDGGRCDHPPSTVVDATGEVPKLLRAGSIDWEEIVAAAGPDGAVTGPPDGRGGGLDATARSDPLDRLRR